MLTLSLNVDSTLGSIQPTRAGVFQPFGFLAVPQSFANASYTQQAYAEADYGVNAYTSLSVRGGYGQTRSSGVNFTTQIWSAGATLSYNFWRNTSIQLSYGFIKTSANEPAYFTLFNSQQLGYV